MRRPGVRIILGRGAEGGMRAMRDKCARFTAILVAVFALLGVSAAAANGPVKGATYAGGAGREPGTFRAGEAVTFRVARNGTHVLNFTTKLGYNGKCGQGGGPN